MQLFDSATYILDSRNKDQVSLEGKLNSIYVLTKLGLNDVNYHDIVLKTFATYIKINSPRANNNSMAEPAKVRSDIMECLLAIGRIKDNWNSNVSLDLSNTLLTSCKLEGNYNNVNFDKCNLNFSEIKNGTFLNASFINSFLVYAKITNSKFSNVSFYHSQLDQVEMRNVQFNNACDLRSAIFTSSTFKNVDMSKLEGLKKSQFFSMVDSANFKLPKTLNIP
jgi:uncharacterized protein YjbI with pentapeptide repeats